MAKRYLGGGISFEQKDVYQEFSEDEGGGGSSTLSGLTDVDISNPTNGDTLVYNSTSEKWENGEGGGGSTTLAGLTDVDISNPTDGQTLVYNATAGKWENGGTLIVNITVHDSGEATEYAIMDKTAGEIMSAINAGTPVIFLQTEPYEDGTIICFGVIAYIDTFEVDGTPGYTFSMRPAANTSDFYHGTYGCLGADAYPRTQGSGE